MTATLRSWASYLDMNYDLFLTIFIYTCIYHGISIICYIIITFNCYHPKTFTRTYKKFVDKVLDDLFYRSGFPFKEAAVEQVFLDSFVPYYLYLGHASLYNFNPYLHILVSIIILVVYLAIPYCNIIMYPVLVVMAVFRYDLIRRNNRGRRDVIDFEIILYYLMHIVFCVIGLVISFVFWPLFLFIVMINIIDVRVPEDERKWKVWKDMKVKKRVEKENEIKRIEQAKIDERNRIVREKKLQEDRLRREKEEIRQKEIRRKAENERLRKQEIERKRVEEMSNMRQFYDTLIKDWDEKHVQIFLDIIGLTKYKENLSFLDGTSLYELKNQKYEYFVKAFNEMDVFDTYAIESIHVSIKHIDFDKKFDKKYLGVKQIREKLHSVSIVIAPKDFFIHQCYFLELNDDKTCMEVFGKTKKELKVFNRCRFECFKLKVLNYIFGNNTITKKKYLSMNELVDYMKKLGLAKYYKDGFVSQKIDGLFLSVLKNSNNLLALNDFLKGMKIDENHYESVLSMIFNMEHYSSMPSFDYIVKEFRELKFKSNFEKNGLEFINRYVVHAGLFITINEANVDCFQLPKLMKKKILRLVEKVKKLFPFVKPVKTLYTKLIEMKKNPAVPMKIVDYSSAKSETPSCPSAPMFDDGEFAIVCDICFTNQLEVELSCGHMLCERCLKRVRKCPFCRKDIKKYFLLTKRKNVRVSNPIPTYPF